MQILWNLAKNSLKYANLIDFIIVINLKLSKNIKMLYLDVCDNGQGIDENTLPKIFEPFYTKGTSGSGLGLYLVRELCSVNNANVTYVKPDNQDKKGACFRISVPVYFSDNTTPNRIFFSYLL